ncbi:MAG: BREX-1 system adenine-specific DNA-methyltransferase PglX, partial [Acidobacteria bacterium]|nr:BREX-1 system adenine-specific DNA-methyltransferase PglX [Acidobacteriota bacterium]
MRALFLRLLRADDKAAALAEAMAVVREGRLLNPAVHLVDPVSFRQVPGSPFAYWVSESIRRLFTELPPFEGEGRTVKQGLATADDFRFVRAWWEVPAETILDGANGPDWKADLPAFQAWCRKRTFEGKRWVPFAKGGEYSPYYADLHLVVNWERDGEEIKERINPESEKPYSNVWQLKGTERDFFFRPGLTWPLRTQLGFNMRAYTGGAIFSHKGPAAFVNVADLPHYLGLANSRAFHQLISLQMAFGSFEVGVIQRTPVLDLSGQDGQRLGELTQSATDLKRALDT